MSEGELLRVVQPPLLAQLQRQVQDEGQGQSQRQPQEQGQHKANRPTRNTRPSSATTTRQAPRTRS
jgi:hypothetical protein